MITLAVAILAVQLIALAVVIVRDTLNPEKEALTMKTFFLGGFILFQSSSGIYTLMSGEYDRVIPGDLGYTGVMFGLFSSIFIVLTLAVYNRGWWVTNFAARPTTERTVSDGGLIGIAFVALLTGVMLRDVMGKIPVLGVLTDMLSTGAFCTALAAVGWVWARRPFNFAAITALVLIGGATVGLILTNTFSRRGLVGAVLATIWAGYFARWRFGYRPTLVLRTAVIGIIGFILVLFQSATRGEKQQGETFFGYLRAFTTVQTRDITDAALGMVSGQFAGANSMWLVETVPSSFEYWPLHSLRYFVTQPIPRVVWSGKPWSLGNEMVLNAGISGVKKDEFSLGPGIVGHLVVDFPFIAIPLYAFLIGLALRYMDDRVALHPNNPFIVIPMGAAAAQVLAFPRGELGLFAFNAVAWIVGATMALMLFGFMARRRDDSADADREQAELAESDEADPEYADTSRERESHTAGV